VKLQVPGGYPWVKFSARTALRVLDLHVPAGGFSCLCPHLLGMKPTDGYNCHPDPPKEWVVWNYLERKKSDLSPQLWWQSDFAP
jgi:hypothetical protein